MALYIPVADSDEKIIIATTRPETMLGDMAVAVHPEDERYTHLVGKMINLPLTDRQIPIIADDYVEKTLEQVVSRSLLLMTLMTMKWVKDTIYLC